ncbi:MAG: recombination protein RecR [Candidatus Kerfeldbacteria bacterium]|nr:recombination protein RecR [Candidatus Kerfeldbacteria bacterium]
MPAYPAAIEQLISQLIRLPGVGRKTAERYALAWLRQGDTALNPLMTAVQAVQQQIGLCQQCYNYTTTERCDICSNPQRDQQLVCVVADSAAVFAFEQIGDYHGTYHVLGGTINPLDGITADQLRLPQLVDRVQQVKVQEIIIGTNPDHPGEATALAVIAALQPCQVKITRLARGLPAGSDIEFADDVTLGEALKDRRTI